MTPIPTSININKSVDSLQPLSTSNLFHHLQNDIILEQIVGNKGQKYALSMNKLETAQLIKRNIAIFIFGPILRQPHGSFSNMHIKTYYHSQTAITQTAYKHAYQQEPQVTNRQTYDVEQIIEKRVQRYRKSNPRPSIKSNG